MLEYHEASPIVYFGSIVPSIKTVTLTIQHFRFSYVAVQSLSVNGAFFYFIFLTKSNISILQNLTSFVFCSYLPIWVGLKFMPLLRIKVVWNCRVPPIHLCPVLWHERWNQEKRHWERLYFTGVFWRLLPNILFHPVKIDETEKGQTENLRRVWKKMLHCILTISKSIQW